jgi:hypothetical protein
MQFLECPISTYCRPGIAASGAAIIPAAGTKAKPIAQLEGHDAPAVGSGSLCQVSDIEIMANEFLKDRHRLNDSREAHGAAHCLHREGNRAAIASSTPMKPRRSESWTTCCKDGTREEVMDGPSRTIRARPLADPYLPPLSG